MKKFKSIATILIVLALSMLVFVSCDKAESQQVDYSIYQGVFYLKDGDSIDNNVWFYFKGDGTWQDNKANCGTYTVDNVTDKNITLAGDLTLSGHIGRILTLYINGDKVEYAMSTDNIIPTPPVEFVCAKYGHDLQSCQAQEPTCIADGCEAYLACKREGCTYSTKKIIPRLGHSYDNGKCVRCGENAPTQEEIENSERIKEEIKNDAPDKKPQDIIVPVVPTKEDGATDEQIALAQQQADEAIEEKSYWTVVEIIKDLYEKKYSNSAKYPNSFVRKINSIKESANKFYMIADVDIVSKDDSKGIYSMHNVALRIEGNVTTQNFADAKGLSEFFGKCNEIYAIMEFDYDNSEFANDFFNFYDNYTGDFVLLASKVIYDENGNFSEVRLKTYSERKQRTRYVGYDFTEWSKYYSKEETIQIVKSGDLEHSFSNTSHSTSGTDIAYDWESANIKYRKS